MLGQYLLNSVHGSQMIENNATDVSLFRSSGVFPGLTVLGVSLVVFSLWVGCKGQFGSAISVMSPNPEERGSFGWSTAGLDDVNDDGIADLAIGAPGEVVEGRPFGGRVYLVSGANGEILGSAASATPQTRGFFGATVAGLGDVNGDGAGDLLVGAHRETVGEVQGAGHVYLCSGADGTVLETLSSPTPVADGNFGSGVAGLGDVNGDEIPDLIVGASDEPAQDVEKAGQVYVLSGADGSVLREFSSPSPEEEGFFGTSVSGLEDVDGDDIPDLAVGAFHETTEDKSNAGRVYLLSGADGSVLQTLTSPNAQAGGIFGGAVAGLGDVNGDSVPDVIVGAHHEQTDEKRRAGRAYLLSGSDGSVLTSFTSPNASTTGLFGESIAATGDANEDGVQDVLVGAHGETARGAFGSGRAYLFGGSDGNLIETFVSPNPEEEGAFGGAVASTSEEETAGPPLILVGAFWETTKNEREGRSYLFGGRR